MKKIFAIVLTLALVMSMSTVAFAADATLTDETSTSEHEVQVKVSNSGADKAVISVDVTYGDLQFTYVSAEASLWNPETHKFEADNDDAGTWQVDGDNTVVVTNHSNRDVVVAVTAEKETTETGDLAINVANGTGTLANGVVDAYDTAASLTATITVSGTPTTQAADYETVGAVTVAITPTETMTNSYN